jgi:hypothetical protein
MNKTSFMVGPSSQNSKILLAFVLLLVIFYIYMDVLLYWRIQYYPIERNYNVQNSTISSMQASQQSLKYSNVTWIDCHFNPLCDATVKSLLLDLTNHYFVAPLVIVFDDFVGLSRGNIITPNMISFFHVFVAALSGRMVASDNLGHRRLGIVLFLFRKFLDSLDGYVARKGQKGEYSEVGTLGYYLDGICDILGSIFVMYGVLVFLKNNVSIEVLKEMYGGKFKISEKI